MTSINGGRSHVVTKNEEHVLSRDCLASGEASSTIWLTIPLTLCKERPRQNTARYRQPYDFSSYMISLSTQV
jgi:hypothetical protein